MTDKTRQKGKNNPHYELVRAATFLRDDPLNDMLNQNPERFEVGTLRMGSEGKYCVSLTDIISGEVQDITMPPKVLECKWAMPLVKEVYKRQKKQRQYSTEEKKKPRKASQPPLSKKEIKEAILGLCCIVAGAGLVFKGCNWVYQHLRHEEMTGTVLNEYWLNRRGGGQSNYSFILETDDELHTFAYDPFGDNTSYGNRERTSQVNYT